MKNFKDLEFNQDVRSSTNDYKKAVLTFMNGYGVVVLFNKNLVDTKTKNFYNVAILKNGKPTPGTEEISAGDRMNAEGVSELMIAIQEL